MVGNGDVVLAAPGGRQADVAARLPGDRVSQTYQVPDQSLGKRLSEASCLQDFVADEVEPDDPGTIGGIAIVAADGVEDVFPKRCQIVGFCENARSKRASCMSTLGRLLH